MRCVGQTVREQQSTSALVWPLMTSRWSPDGGTRIMVRSSRSSRRLLDDVNNNNYCVFLLRCRVFSSAAFVVRFRLCFTRVGALLFVTRRQETVADPVNSLQALVGTQAITASTRTTNTWAQSIRSTAYRATKSAASFRARLATSASF